MENYNELIRRKSFHKFTDIIPFTADELKEIEKYLKTVKPLDDSIKVELEIVPVNKTICSAGGEYCVLIYSEKKEGYLINAGYIGQQIDLYFASKNIGSLWYGLGTAKQRRKNGLYYAIMLNFSKVKNPTFRDSNTKRFRKELDEIWEGETIKGVSEIVRLAPSAVNKQPWLVINKDKELMLIYKKPKDIGLVPMAFFKYMNNIDLGIFMLYLELCLEHEQIKFERLTNFTKRLSFDQLIATYKIENYK